MTPIYKWLSAYISKGIYVWSARGENDVIHFYILRLLYYLVNTREIVLS